VMINHLSTADRTASGAETSATRATVVAPDLFLSFFVARRRSR